MNANVRAPARSWFRSANGRRYGREMAVVHAAKLTALLLLYFLLFAPQPRADTSPASMCAQMLDAPAARGSSP
jgi:hypothetical protein